MDERAKIREYVEEIVAEMLGGNLDHIRVGQLSKSENCKYPLPEIRLMQMQFI